MLQNDVRGRSIQTIECSNCAFGEDAAREMRGEVSVIRWRKRLLTDEIWMKPAILRALLVTSYSDKIAINSCHGNTCTVNID